MSVKLYNKSYVEYLRRCKPFRMAFADPPDNIGLGYDGYDDKIPDFEYDPRKGHFVIGRAKKTPKHPQFGISNPRRLALTATAVN